jgi:hypothetical protein
LIIDRYCSGAKVYGAFAMPQRETITPQELSRATGI